MPLPQFEGLFGTNCEISLIRGLSIDIQNFIILGSKQFKSIENNRV